MAPWSLISTIRRWLGLILPLFSKVGHFRGVAFLKWVLHFLLVAVIVVGLYFLNKNQDVQRWIGGSPFVQELYLPILFLLIYAVGWFGWMVWKLLGASEGSADYPDIDDAWEEGLLGLQ